MCSTYILQTAILHRRFISAQREERAIPRCRSKRAVDATKLPGGMKIENAKILRKGLVGYTHVLHLLIFAIDSLDHDILLYEMALNIPAYQEEYS